VTCPYGNVYVARACDGAAAARAAAEGAQPADARGGGGGGGGGDGAPLGVALECVALPSVLGYFVMLRRKNVASLHHR